MTAYCNDLVCITTRKTTYIGKVNLFSLELISCFENVSRSGIIALSNNKQIMNFKIETHGSKLWLCD